MKQRSPSMVADCRRLNWYSRLYQAAIFCTDKTIAIGCTAGRQTTLSKAVEETIFYTETRETIRYEATREVIHCLGMRMMILCSAKTVTTSFMAARGRTSLMAVPAMIGSMEKTVVFRSFSWP